jgi:asparagine synthase (glutamine-hydrolysing)
MCGIAGYFGSGNQNILNQMIDIIKHRGPNNTGIFCNDKIGLAHARLSIIDTSTKGNQPMSDQNKKVWITFNGEIYNFSELKQELKQDGIKFQSNSDTEVLIYLYKKYNVNFLQKINGMFALCIYDAKKEEIILARDRFGKKPLYWGIFKNTLIFGSELKALTAHPDFIKKIDINSLNKYLQFEYIPTPHTIIENTFKLEPGTYLKFDGQKIEKNKYWDIKFNKNQDIKEKEALKELNREINQSVKKRLISDVPLGVFLSGGLDSSAICYYAQKNSTKKINTFSIGFEEKSFDESNYARQVAKHLQTNHHEKIFSIKECLNVIPEIFSKLDEPMADSSILPSYLLAKFAREKIIVSLGGDGGDELFCGYDTFVAEKHINIYKKLPKLIQASLEKNASKLPTSFSNISLDFKIKKFLSGVNVQNQHRHHIWLGSFSYEERKQLLKKNIWDTVKNTNEFEDIDNYWAQTDNHWDKLILLYLRTYLMDDILVKADRASMFNSLELRSPFLDFELADFVNSLPQAFKYKGRHTKYLFKKLLENKLPKEIIYRKKKGFGIPIAEWLCTDLKPLTLEMLSEKRIKEQGLFNYKYIKQLLEDHFSHKKDNRKPIWTLLVFQLWYENFFK